VPWPVFDERKDQQFRTSLLQFAIEVFRLLAERAPAANVDDGDVARNAFSQLQ